MKPAPFRYSAPETVEEALDLLAEAGADGKVLAGGQSLIPILNMRLATPGHLVDINRITGLDYVRSAADGVEVGALARHARIERDPAAYDAVPLLRRALRLVAHPVVRNRGTTVGSLAHADPAGEMTAVLTLLGGSVQLRRRGGHRRVAAADFFVGPLECAAAPDELVVCAHFPAPPPGTGTDFAEVSRRHGDYAVCGVAVAVTLDDDRRVSAARAAYISVASTPLLLDLTDAVGGAAADATDWAAAGRLARDRVDPDADIHASADYRRHLAGVLTERALHTAAGRVPTTGRLAS